MPRNEGPVPENCTPAGLVTHELVGRKVAKVFKERIEQGDKYDYEYYLVLGDDKATTKIIPLGSTITVHVYDKPNKFTGIF